MNYNNQVARLIFVILCGLVLSFEEHSDNICESAIKNYKTVKKMTIEYDKITKCMFKEDNVKYYKISMSNKEGDCEMTLCENIKQNMKISVDDGSNCLHEDFVNKTGIFTMVLPYALVLSHLLFNC